MKSKIVVLLVIMIDIMFSTSSIYGQDSIRPILNKQLRLNGETGEQVVLMALRDSLKYVSIKITAIIQNGELTVELYDPTGEKYGNFSIAGAISSGIKNEDQFIRGKMYTSNASGSLLRTIKNPSNCINWLSRRTDKRIARPPRSFSVIGSSISEGYFCEIISFRWMHFPSR